MLFVFHMKRQINLLIFKTIVNRLCTQKLYVFITMCVCVCVVD